MSRDPTWLGGAHPGRGIWTNAIRLVSAATRACTPAWCASSRSSNGCTSTGPSSSRAPRTGDLAPRGRSRPCRAVVVRTPHRQSVCSRPASSSTSPVASPDGHQGGQRTALLRCDVSHKTPRKVTLSGFRARTRGRPVPLRASARSPRRRSSHLEVSVDRASPEARTLELGWSGSPSCASRETRSRAHGRRRRVRSRRRCGGANR